MAAAGGDRKNLCAELTADKPIYSQLLINKKGDQKPGCSYRGLLSIVFCAR